ncbi:MAG: hypothetical protein N2449_04695 [Bacteroidales bacterium]|nr:hypothetical protein [Bacteroidales bacterium]
MKWVFFIFILLSAKVLSAQEFFSEQNAPNNTKNKFSFDRFFFGGNFGLQVGNYTIIELSPLIGYRITERFSAGTQINYSYIHVSQFNLSTSIYGSSAFLTYYLSKKIFLRSEYEWLSLESRYFNPAIYQTQKRFSVHSVLVGGGYREQIGERSYINLMILWNLNESALSPYQNPIIRMSFEF